MNTKQKLHQQNLAMWNNRFQDQAQSGLSVKKWCILNNISIHAYNYWKHIAKEEYLDSILPDIVPLAAPSDPLLDYSLETIPTVMPTFERRMFTFGELVQLPQFSTIPLLFIKFVQQIIIEFLF